MISVYIACIDSCYQFYWLLNQNNMIIFMIISLYHVIISSLTNIVLNSLVINKKHRYVNFLTFYHFVLTELLFI